MTVTTTSLRQRFCAAALTASVVVALGYALLVGLAFHVVAKPVQQALATFRLAPEAPPPERVIPPPRAVDRPSGRASAPNLRATATEVTAPVPILPDLAPPPPIVVAPLSGAGVQASVGASDRAGPGTGAGGTGNGNGAGGNGDGEGSGRERVPRLIRDRIKGSDVPAPILLAGFRGVVGVRYQVETDGRVSGCAVVQSSGNAVMDQATCRAIEKRFRYDPWRDAAGRPVRSTVLREQRWEIDPARG